MLELDRGQSAGRLSVFRCWRGSLGGPVITNHLQACQAACGYSTSLRSGPADLVFRKAGDFYVGVQTKRGWSPHLC